MEEMTVDGPIVLGTSLAPFNYEQQRMNVRSWLENNFKVVSFNCKEEIETIQPFFSDLDVEFFLVERSASSIAGKPLPYIQDILDVTSDKAAEVCGFINSDIYLINIEEEMMDFLKEQAKESLIIVRRNEITSYEDISTLNWNVHFDGFDMFLIDKNLAKNFYDDGFFVQSSWCYCLLVKSLLLGCQIKELKNPIAFHIKHAQKWNFETTNFLICQFWNKYFETAENAYQKAKNSYYYITLEKCEQICFVSNVNYRCLWVCKNVERKMADEIKEGNHCDIDFAEKEREYRD